jgi:UDP-N-acetylglucosamine--N-acetylmuramyl-(pentapeptide) pyrophosphoryl-undecaprenol N-acetylglucosamine transferase
MSGPTSTAPTWALIAGGGTAGHVLPGLAVARELVERGHDPASIHFVGASRGIEAELVPDAGFGITLLPGRGVQRRLTWDNVGAVVGLLRAAARALSLVRRRRPAVVLALGGFASAAVSVAAVLWRVPLVVADQNARAGAANRLVGRFAAACAVPFPETDLPKAVVTGNPVREEILAVATAPDRDAARRALGLPLDRTLLVAFAGSLGSRRLNQAVEGAVSTWSDREDLAVYHVVGARDWAARTPLSPTLLDYRPVRYESRMQLALAAADLVVCRSGGTTVAELAVIGVPSILVPLPIATRDHQTANAGPLVRAGAAVLVPDDQLDAARLAAEVDALVAEGPARLSAMADAARSLGRPDAAHAVADLIESSARSADGAR